MPLSFPHFISRWGTPEREDGVMQPTKLWRAEALQGLPNVVGTQANDETYL